MLQKFLAVTLLAVLFSPVSDEPHGWAVIYLNSEVDPTRSYAMYCPNNPGCNTVYHDVETTKWFPSRGAALDFVNGFWVDAGFSSGPLSKQDLSGNPVNPNPMDADRIVGIYECKKIPLRLRKIGIHHEQISVKQDKEVDTMQWE